MLLSVCFWTGNKGIIILLNNSKENLNLEVLVFKNLERFDACRCDFIVSMTVTSFTPKRIGEAILNGKI